MTQTIYIGNEVLIFELDKDGKENNGKFIKGKVKNIIIHNKGLENQEFDYEVIGENKKTYVGSYGIPKRGNIYFRTLEDHRAYLQKNIDSNNALISQLNQTNSAYMEIIKKISKNKNDFSLSPHNFLTLLIGIYKLSGEEQLNISELERFVFNCKFDKKYNEFLNQISFLDNFKMFFNEFKLEFLRLDNNDIIIILPQIDVENLIANNLPYINSMSKFMNEFKAYQLSISENLTPKK